MTGQKVFEAIAEELATYPTKTNEELNKLYKQTFGQLVDDNITRMLLLMRYEGLVVELSRREKMDDGTFDPTSTNIEGLENLDLVLDFLFKCTEIENRGVKYKLVKVET